MVMLDRRVIVHVVAAEIGEPAGGKAHTVQTALVQTVAGGFHRAMSHAGNRQFREQLVQGDWIRRRQRSIVLAARCNHACGADARRGEAGMRPYLPRERDD